VEQLSADLERWDDVAQHQHWRGLLVGNGASRAVWAKFQYRSLYETACNLENGGLDGADREIFQRLNTHNFESVLAALWTAQTVNGILELPTKSVWARYMSIRRALANAVRAVHIPWHRVQATEVLGVVSGALHEYQWVFSTNYDLLVYWAIMARLGDPPDVRDYFWNRPGNNPGSPWLSFEPWNVSISGNVTRVLYLHGGLHLYELPDARAVKRIAGDENLLDLFYGIAERETAAIPLFVAEGSAVEKLAAIGASPYLSFAYEQLVVYRGPLVIFGHGLGPSDRHISVAIAGSRGHHLAISIEPLDADHIRREKARYMQIFPAARVRFFDATTHPLGSPTVRVTEA
jgi:hypothetical protein